MTDRAAEEGRNSLDEDPLEGDALEGNASEEDPLDRAFAEYLRRCDSGEVISRETFLAQFDAPLADQLSELMQAADRIGQMTQVRNVGGTENPGDTPVVGADTIAAGIHDGDLSGDNAAVTLPVARRRKGDHGPTLPFDLGDYELLEVIGRGGMGVVYLARQKQLDRNVAVKMIRSGILASEDEVKRFYTEAQAAARLHHPNIVSVHQFGRRADHHFFSMEHIEGIDLQRKINGHVLDFEEAARYVRDVARAIDHAHEKGVLHRDLKPANVLIDLKNQVHITDFGLAKHIDGDSSVTGSNDALGTPHYMAPEQAGGHSDRAIKQSDVYSLGAILFASLSGRPPIVADTVMQTLVQVVHEPAPSVRSVRGDTPVDLETIIAKCLEKNPLKRYATAGELADDLDAYLDGRPILARPRNAAVRALSWFGEVPLFGALAGRRVLTSSHGHRRFQAAMLFMMLVAPICAATALLYIRHVKDAMPSVVKIAGGIDGGLYNETSAKIAESISQTTDSSALVIPSGGSIDNRDALVQGRVHLAPMQATAMSGNEICVVAPLFYEMVYAMARVDTGIETMLDLPGHSVALGPPGSGSREAAELIFQSLPIDLSRMELVAPQWDELFSSSPPDAAILCLGRGSPLIERLLDSEQWTLIEIPDGVNLSLEHPTLRPMRISAADHPDVDMPKRGIETVGTTTFLAARVDAPADLITKTLEDIYANPPSPDLIPRRQAPEWLGHAFHPAARRFFEAEQ